MLSHADVACDKLETKSNCFYFCFPSLSFSLHDDRRYSDYYHCTSCFVSLASRSNITGNSSNVYRYNNTCCLGSHLWQSLCRWYRHTNFLSIKLLRTIIGCIVSLLLLLVLLLAVVSLVMALSHWQIKADRKQVVLQNEHCLSSSGYISNLCLLDWVTPQSRVLERRILSDSIILNIS